MGNDISFFVTIDILGSGKREGLVLIIRKGKEKKKETGGLLCQIWIESEEPNLFHKREKFGPRYLECVFFFFKKNH